MMAKSIGLDCLIYEGEINNQKANLKDCYNDYGYDSEGKIGDKKIFIHKQDYTDNMQLSKINGSYGNKEFNLIVEIPTNARKINYNEEKSKKTV